MWSCLADGTTTSILLSKMVHQGGGSVVFAAHRDDAGWSAPVRMSPPPEDETYYDTPRQVMHDHTTTILVGGWGVCACPMRLQVITRDEGEDYSAPLIIAEGEDLTPLGLWANEDGAALAVWEREVELEEFSAASYRSSSVGAWSDPVDLPPAAGGKVLAGAVLAAATGWCSGTTGDASRPGPGRHRRLRGVRRLNRRRLVVLLLHTRGRGRPRLVA